VIIGGGVVIVGCGRLLIFGKEGSFWFFAGEVEASGSRVVWKEYFAASVVFE
jgi:hypothetical protein